MRLIVYFLSLLMIFMPSYSAYASGISKGQIVAIGKAGGAMIKTAGGKIMKLPPTVRGGGAVLVWCMFDKKCRDKMGMLLNWLVKLLIYVPQIAKMMTLAVAMMMALLVMVV